MQSNSNRDRNCCTATQRETRAAWLFLLPSLTGVVLFVLLPFAETVRRSLFDTMGTAWVGLSNYRSVIQNGAFQLAVHNTARFLGICLPILLSGSLVLALVLHSRPLRQTRAARIFKTTFLLPIAIPVASIVLLWQTLFARQGLCNGWLTCLGVQPIDFMGTGTAFWVLTGTYLWKNCGYTSILWTAGLEAIPVDQYEAARVDGAGTWQQFWHITWPELQPTLALTLILSLLNAFKVFREAYLVAGRYPQQSIYLLQHLFNNWFLSLDLPRLAAAAVLVALVLNKWEIPTVKDNGGEKVLPDIAASIKNKMQEKNITAADLVGVGIGGTFDKAALLAKQALLRDLDTPHEDPFYRKLEQDLLEKINALGIGPQGFGGRTTALAVNILACPTHIAGLPVAVNLNCHVTRHVTEVL